MIIMDSNFYFVFQDSSNGLIHCYLIEQSKSVKWESAEDTCAGYGETSHLASIHSGEEMSYLISSANSNIWIGGKRPKG